MNQILRGLAASLALTVAASLPLSAQSGRTGTILIAHGGGPAWDAQVQTIAGLADTGGPVEVALLMGSGAPSHRFQDAAERLEQAGVTEIVVVPLLVSSHSSHFQQIRYLAGATDTLSEQMRHHLHMAGIERADVRVPILLTPAIDDSPEVARVLAARARALATDPSRQALYLVGHGPNSAEATADWMHNLRPIADSVRVASGFRDVKLGLVRDDAPERVRAEAVRGIREIIELQHELTGEPVVVVPILISTGSVSREKLPRDLAGLPIVYSGDALLPHEGMARWVEARVRDASGTTSSR